MELAAKQVCSRVSRIAIGVTLFAGSENNSYFDRWIRGFHLLEINRRALRVSVAVIGFVVRIRFPGAVAFIADLPVSETVMVCRIRVANPGSSFCRRATPVIDGNECL